MSGKLLRCAVYTRKSTDEGLEKAFDSLDAQREACEAFIRAQAHEGWVLVPDAYDDGGYSGGSLDRPALQSLLGAIDAGRVDIIVVYKIDRLTRSLADFAKLVERFDARAVSFVSVTQAFNTTNSMGRLTLNVLLSFAQFEREVTAERIRDKIAASRAKGMWMGGGVPLGYVARDRQLHVDPKAADRVRWIFDQYLAQPSLGALAAELNAKDNTNPAHLADGSPPDPQSPSRSRWTAGALGYLLRNRTYLGEAVHKGRSHAGRHAAIIERPVFDAVQTLLTSNANIWSRKRTVGASCLLTGLVHDDQGHRMTPQWSLGSTGQRHGYYVSAAKLRGNRHLTPGTLPRLRADGLDAFILRVWRILSPSAADAIDRDALRRDLVRITLSTGSIETLWACDVLGLNDESGEPVASQARSMLAPLGLDQCERRSGQLRLFFRIDLRRRGGAKSHVPFVTPMSAGPMRLGEPDPRLVRALQLGHDVRRQIERGQIHHFEDWTGTDSAPGRNATRDLFRLALLAPDIQRRIVLGDHPAWWSVKAIAALTLPPDWQRQRQMLGLGSGG